MRSKLLLVLLIAAALAGGGYAYYLRGHVDSPLTGEPVSRNVAEQRPVAVILDNFSPDARPQSGLSAASLVFETLAEGGITRFMAVYLDRDAPKIGPVRSTRLYFNSWVAGIGAIFGHDGGNVNALQQLPNLASVYNEDADRVVGPFWRDPARQVPHNEYTSTESLRSYAASHGGGGGSSGMSIPHKGDAPPSDRPQNLTLSIQFSYGDYNVSWRYDRDANDWVRSMGGSPHIDPSTGGAIRAKNVVVMFLQESPDQDPYTPGAIRLGTEGTGKATVYEDGKAIGATWSKPSIDSPLQWVGADGKPIKLDRGSTWVEGVPAGNGVTTSGG